MKALFLLISLVTISITQKLESVTAFPDNSAFENFLSKFPEIHHLENKHQIYELCKLAKNELSQTELDFLQNKIHDLQINKEDPFFLVPVFQFRLCKNFTGTLLFLEKSYSNERHSILIIFDQNGNVMNYIFSKKMTGKMDEISQTIDQQFLFKSFNKFFQIKKNGKIMPLNDHLPKA